MNNKSTGQFVLLIKFSERFKVHTMHEGRFTELLGDYIADFTKKSADKKTTSVKAYPIGLLDYMDNKKFSSGDVQQILRIAFVTGEGVPENGGVVTKTFYGFTRNRFYASSSLGRRDGADDDWFPIALGTLRMYLLPEGTEEEGEALRWTISKMKGKAIMTLDDCSPATAMDHFY